MHLPGSRVVKTAVAVFLTAFICQLIGWPPVFAVITAIVTLEPTAADSVKKGIVRFPASAIGSFYAVLFIALFGNSPITYMLAATLTIITCFSLRLHAGLLVATITAVAMVEVVHDNYLMSFFIRLGTTSIGIIVSTLVNMFIFPPNYIKTIETNIKKIYIDLGTALSKIDNKTKMESMLRKIRQEIVQTEVLIRYQTDEADFHPLFDNEAFSQTNIVRKIDQLELIHYHINNLQPIYIKQTAFSEDHIIIIHQALDDLTAYMKGNEQIKLEQHEMTLKNLMRMFWGSNHGKETFNNSLLPDELILLYELISIFYVVKETKQLSTTI